MDIPQKSEAGAWRIPSGSDRHHRLPNDATLFSSSLHVLPHGKLQLSDNRDGLSLIYDEIDSRSNKFHESVDDIESHSIGNLLPDEDELLTGMMGDFDLTELPYFDDYDLFGSGGGMELGPDFRDGSSMSGPPRLSISSLGGNAIPQFNVQNGAGTGEHPYGEHPYGEHPSRTLFVRNINSNVEDSELEALFKEHIVGMTNSGVCFKCLVCTSSPTIGRISMSSELGRASTTSYSSWSTDNRDGEIANSDSWFLDG